MWTNHSSTLLSDTLVINVLCSHLIPFICIPFLCMLIIPQSNFLFEFAAVSDHSLLPQMLHFIVIFCCYWMPWSNELCDILQSRSACNPWSLQARTAAQSTLEVILQVIEHHNSYTMCNRNRQYVTPVKMLHLTACTHAGNATWLQWSIVDAWRPLHLLHAILEIQNPDLQQIVFRRNIGWPRSCHHGVWTAHAQAQVAT